MAITVADIEQKEFAYKGQGYDPYDVDQYLDQICDEMVAMQDRIDALEAELKKAQQAAQNAAAAVTPVVQPVVQEPAESPVAKTSETLENILLSAQRIGDEAIETAKRRAEEIVKEAEKKADDIVGNTREEKANAAKELETLRTAAKDFKTRFVALLKDQRELLDSDDKLFEDDK